MRTTIVLAVVIGLVGCGAPVAHRVTYEAGSSAPNIKVTWMDQHGTQQATSGAFGPSWSASSANVPGGTVVSMTAQSSAATGYVRCAISVDGKEAAAKRSDGAYSVAVCTAVVP